MTMQTLIKNIGARIRREQTSEVVLSLPQWQQIEDIVLEFSSPELLKSLKRSRQDYQKAKPYLSIRKKLIK